MDDSSTAPDDRLSDRPNYALEPVALDIVFKNYQKLGGKIDRERFELIVPVFIELTVDAFTGGDIANSLLTESSIRDISSRDVAMERWATFMKNIGHGKTDVSRVFHAIDMFAGYS